MDSIDKRLQTSCESFTNHLALHVLRGFHWRDCRDYHVAGLCSDFSRALLVERTRGTSGGILVQHAPRRTVTLRPGHVYLIPAGVRFDLTYREGLVMYSTYLRLDGPFGEDLLGSIGSISERVLPKGHGAVIARLAETRHSVGDALHFRSALIAAIAPLMTLPMQEVAIRSRLAERYADLLRELERIPPALASVTLLARRLHLPADTLAKRFRRDVGIALKPFLMERLRRRITAALGSTQGSLADLAASLGFSDQFYFSRCCKRLTGLAPRAYRQQAAMPLMPEV